MRLYIRKDGSYAGTQADAGKGFEQVEVPTDKAGLIAYLNDLVNCADRTPPLMLVDPAGVHPPVALEPAKPCAITQSINMDEAFDALPLARQLHFASIATENARASIKQ